MTKLYDVGLLTLLSLMVISAAAGYFGERFTREGVSDHPTVQDNIDVDGQPEESHEREAKDAYP